MEALVPVVVVVLLLSQLELYLHEIILLLLVLEEQLTTPVGQQVQLEVVEELLHSHPDNHMRSLQLVVVEEQTIELVVLVELDLVEQQTEPVVLVTPMIMTLKIAVTFLELPVVLEQMLLAVAVAVEMVMLAMVMMAVPVVLAHKTCSAHLGAEVVAVEQLTMVALLSLPHFKGLVVKDISMVVPVVVLEHLLPMEL